MKGQMNFGIAADLKTTELFIGAKSSGNDFAQGIYGNITSGHEGNSQQKEETESAMDCNEEKRVYVQHFYRDHVRDPIYKPTDSSTISNNGVSETIVKRRRGPRGGVAEPFPVKLHSMLSQVENDGVADVVSWQSHGRCFVIRQPKRFVEEVMPRYFKQSKFTSFQRQVNLYGFRRLTRGRDRGGYYHELLIRGRPDLCLRMLRQRIKGNGTKAAPSPTTEPNFYDMEFCCENNRVGLTKITAKKLAENNKNLGRSEVAVSACSLNYNKSATFQSNEHGKLQMQHGTQSNSSLLNGIRLPHFINPDMAFSNNSMSSLFSKNAPMSNNSISSSIGYNGRLDSNSYGRNNRTSVDDSSSLSLSFANPRDNSGIGSTEKLKTNTEKEAETNANPPAMSLVSLAPGIIAPLCTAKNTANLDPLHELDLSYVSQLKCSSSLSDSKTSASTPTVGGIPQITDKLCNEEVKRGALCHIHHMDDEFQRLLDSIDDDGFLVQGST